MEIWKEIEGYSDYQVSNLGRVKSCKFGKEKILSLGNDGRYLQAQLRKDNKKKVFLLHRLIAIAFIPNPDNLPYIDHINRVKTDNRIENLRWVTPSENNLNQHDRVNATGHKHISRCRPGYLVRIQRNNSILFSKYFPTLEEAIVERNKFIDTL